MERAQNYSGESKKKKRRKEKGEEGYLWGKETGCRPGKDRHTLYGAEEVRIWSLDEKSPGQGERRERREGGVERRKKKLI